MHMVGAKTRRCAREPYPRQHIHVARQSSRFHRNLYQSNAHLAPVGWQNASEMHLGSMRKSLVVSTSQQRNTLSESQQGILSAFHNSTNMLALPVEEDDKGRE